MKELNFEKIFNEIENHVSNTKFKKLGQKPVFSYSANSKIAIISQAPGLKSQTSGISWDDPSGDNLRNWLGVLKNDFYNPNNFAFIPMDFYFPGKGKTGDIQPRKDFAPDWHFKLWEIMQEIELKILIGQYSQKFYLKDNIKTNLTQTVYNYTDYLPEFFVLPHPSPRNRFWINKNPWFKSNVLPALKKRIAEILS